MPDMCGIGPFIPQRDTPFRDIPAGSGELTVFLLSVIRLIKPNILLPATTALGTIMENGRGAGDTGRSQCYHAESVSTVRTEKVFSVR